MRSRISEAACRRFLRHVVVDLAAAQIARLADLNRNTVNHLLARRRERMAEACEIEWPLRGYVEVDESYFGPRRGKGKTDRGAGRKTIVFGIGIGKRHGKVCTVVVPDGSKAVPLAAIRGEVDLLRGNVDLQGIVHSDGWAGCDALVDTGCQKHLCVGHATGEFSGASVRGNDINGIEGFCGYAESRLARFRGIHPHAFLVRFYGVRIPPQPPPPGSPPWPAHAVQRAPAQLVMTPRPFMLLAICGVVAECALANV